MAGASIDRFDLAAVTLGCSAVDDHTTVADVVGNGCGIDHGVSGPGQHGPRRCRHGGSRTGLERGRAVGREPPAESSVEQRSLTTEDPQHPDQPSGDHASGIVVGDDDGVVTDSFGGEAFGEHLRLGHRMATQHRCRGRSEDGVEVDAPRSRKVSGQEGIAPDSTVEVGASVADDDIVAVLIEPAEADDGVDRTVRRHVSPSGSGRRGRRASRRTPRHSRRSPRPRDAPSRFDPGPVR